MVKNYNAIDCMKLAMAILVVAIHTHPLACFGSETLNEYFSLLTSLAVPFFFIASGFFLYNKIVDAPREERLERIKKWWMRIVKLYLTWTAIYLPFTIYGFYLDGLSPLKSLVLFIKNVLLVGQNYWSWPLWYLLAMLVAGALIYCMEKMKFSYFLMLIFSIVLTGFGWGLDYLHNLQNAPVWSAPIVDLYYKLFMHTRNGFFQGLIYMMLGIGVAKNRRQFNFKSLVLVFLFLFGLYLIEIPFAIYFVCLFLFLLVKSIVINGKVGDFKNIRLASTIVYFIHMLFTGCCFLIFGEAMNSLALFSIVLGLSLLFSWCALTKQTTTWFKLCFN